MNHVNYLKLLFWTSLGYWTLWVSDESTGACLEIMGPSLHPLGLPSIPEQVRQVPAHSHFSGTSCFCSEGWCLRPCRQLSSVDAPSSKVLKTGFLPSPTSVSPSLIAHTDECHAIERLFRLVPSPTFSQRQGSWSMKAIGSRKAGRSWQSVVPKGLETASGQAGDLLAIRRP